MAFALDASVTAAWLLPDEENPLAEFVQSLLPDHSAAVPTVWWFEIRNLLIVAERRGRISRRETDRITGNLAVYPIVLDREPSETDVLDIARRHSLTVYDASYIELARRLGLPLATLDRRMAAAAQDEDVPLVVAVPG